MDFNELKIFKAVAEEGSVSRAAIRLHCVQSNVTARLRHLEERLNVTLFHRQSRGVALTSAGKILFEYAGRIMTLIDEAERIVQEREPLGGRLTIGAVETTAAVRLPTILADYHRRFPGVELQLVTGTAMELIRQTLDYSLDGAFVDGVIDHPDLVVEDYFMEEMILIATKGTDPFCHEKQITILVFPSGCFYRRQLESWLHTSGFVPFKIMEFTSIETIIGCVAAGMGISFLPRSVLLDKADNAALALHTLPLDIAKVTSRFIRRKDPVEPKVLSSFRAVAQELSR